MNNRLLHIALAAIIACSCWGASWAHNKLTPYAQLTLSQQKLAKYDLKGNRVKPLDAGSSIKLVVEVDAREAASTFASIREAGGTVLSKLGHQAVISIAADRVDALAGIEGVKSIDATHQGELKTDVSRVETGVSLIDGTTPGTDVAYTGEGVTIVLIDQGFDFQHPAFKDADGNTRLKCVYMPGNDAGHKFIVDDEEAGPIVYPGSVFDTPELIATLTYDTDAQTHGTHTAGIAAGSRSPQGFGGMAPDADIVLVAVGEGNDFETVIQFVAHYAQQVDGPVVLSASTNSHLGPHNGTGTIPELIGYVSQYVIPVFSVGNEGRRGLHIYKAFDEENNSMKALLPRSTPFFTPDGTLMHIMGSVMGGYSRNTLGTDDALSVQIGVIDRYSGELLWQTEPCVITPSQKGLIEISTEKDEGLAQYIVGGGVAISGEVREGKVKLATVVQGLVVNQRQPFFISLSSTSPIEMDLWETIDEFDRLELEGYTYGDSEISCGDWTTTPNVISVGNYVDNPVNRLYTGVVDDGSGLYPLNDISPSSSYGVSLNGLPQPTVTAPGTFVVSSWNYYNCDREIAESMQWQGHPYGGMSGTSMSCPTVSGIIALWLQADPTLKLDDIKQVLAATSRNDEYTAINPVKWGYGKIDAAAGMEYVKSMSGISTISSDVPSDCSDLWFDITGRCYNSKPTAPGLYINRGKKVLITP